MAYKNSKQKNSLLSAIFYYGKVIIVTIVVMAVIRFFIFPSSISGSSMENTIHDKDYVLVSAQSYKLFKGKPKRGDIVIFPVIQKDGEPVPGKGKNQENYIKRVIGVAGDRITVHGGNVYVNGKKIKEKYIKDGKTDGEIIDIKIPNGEVFVMGDNRLNSEDSRIIGTVPIDIIEGKTIIRVYPDPVIF